MTTEAQPVLDPHRTALLVMDYQNGVVGRIADAGALLARVAGAIATVRARGGHVSYVRVAFEDADYASFPPTSRMASLVATAGRRFDAGSPATAIDDRVAPQSGDIVVRKTRVGAFSTTDLDRQLRDIGVDTLILAGISTSGVVLSTLRDASDRDYQIVVLADGCADFDPEVHDVLMRKVFPRQAHVLPAAELPGLFRQHR
jgi:nicotinamidase-related amidase